MQRRIRAWFLVLLVMVSIMGAPVVANAASFTSSNAGIKYGSTYKIGATSTTWKKKLGSYSRKKYDACTAGCISYMYTFKGVKVETIYDSKKKSEKIVGFVISSSRIPTAAGLKVGQSVAQMEKLYGKKYKKSSSTYTYSSGGRAMRVKTNSKTKKITSITIIG